MRGIERCINVVVESVDGSFAIKLLDQVLNVEIILMLNMKVDVPK